MSILGIVSIALSSFAVGWSLCSAFNYVFERKIEKIKNRRPPEFDEHGNFKI